LANKLLANCPGGTTWCFSKLKTPVERLAYAQRAIDHGWSRNVLALHIEQRSLEREGKAINNFDQRLPRPTSDLARESLKDPYRLDFLHIAEDADERAIESALVQHMMRFLLELGAGFAFVGRQVYLEVGGRDRAQGG
jgi:predicted nuclease of restriction endonuclease-like (RecB) superfamily